MKLEDSLTQSVLSKSTHLTLLEPTVPTTTTMPPIRNPILPGFNADPSILRVGDDYYIATSTFEWFPGVQIHHSTDLANWDLVCRPLSRKSQLDMRGNPDSCGIWAPCLTHDGKSLDGSMLSMMSLSVAHLMITLTNKSEPTH